MPKKLTFFGALLSIAIVTYYHATWIYVWFNNPNTSFETKKQLYGNCAPMGLHSATPILLLLVAATSVFLWIHYLSFLQTRSQIALGYVGIVYSALVALLSLWQIL